MIEVASTGVGIRVAYSYRGAQVESGRQAGTEAVTTTSWAADRREH